MFVNIIFITLVIHFKVSLVISAKLVQENKTITHIYKMMYLKQKIIALAQLGQAEKKQLLELNTSLQLTRAGQKNVKTKTSLQLAWARQKNKTLSTSISKKVKPHII